MAWFNFGRKRKAAGNVQPYNVGFIIVPESLVKGDAYDLMHAVITFVNKTIQESGFAREEIPAEALIAYHVDYYLAQVNNGGHSQFGANSGCNEATMEDIRAGLSLIGETGAAAIFGDFERLRRDDPARFEAAIAGGGFGGVDPYMADLDDRFFDGPTKSIPAANNAWIRALPCLKPVPDAEYPAAMREAIDGNRNASARIAERARLVEEERRRDPLFQGLKFIAERPGSDTRFEAWHAGALAQTEDGRKGGLWSISTNHGRGEIYIFPHIALLRRTAGTGDVVAIPIADVERAVKKRTGQALPAGAYFAE